MACVADKRYSVKRKGMNFIFNIPNYLIDLSWIKVLAFRKKVNTEEYNENYVKHKERTKAKRGEKFVKNIIFNEYFRIKNKINDLEKSNKLLKVENK